MKCKICGEVFGASVESNVCPSCDGREKYMHVNEAYNAGVKIGMKSIADMTIEERIEKGLYKNNKPWSGKKGDSSIRREYNEESANIKKGFQTDLETTFGLKHEDTKNDKLFETAWDLSHTYGFYEVFAMYEKLSQLVK